MNKFNEREKSFENKYAHDQELQFKVNVKRNKYLAEWVCNRLGKSNVEDYVKALIKADFQEPGDQDLIKKIQEDFKANNTQLDPKELNKEIQSCFERAKKDFL
jgi:hypothetical protein